LPAKLGQWLQRTQSFLCCSAVSIDPSGQRASEISYPSADGAKSKGPSMSIKFEGKPPFYLGIAEVASAHALDGSVVLRATISVPELRPKSVPVQFILAIDVAKALAEQLPIAVRTAELQKQRGG
jgi:kynureninase